MIVFTDASNIGWGGVIKGQTRAGENWTPIEASNHINYLELLAILYSLQAFKENIKDALLKVMCDNTTADSCINHMGTSHSDLCKYTDKGNLGVVCKVQYLADSSTHSRSRHKKLLQCALSTLNYCPDVDLFASRHNTQCKLYASYRPDPGRMAVVAFSLNWHSIMFYAFPPFSVLTQTIQKIEKEEATGVVVAPNWPTQVWYPALMRLLIAHPLPISPDKSNLSLACYSQEIHPFHKTLQLLVCHVSGKASKRQAFQNKLPPLCSKLGAKVRRNNMTHILKNGYCTVIPQGVIHFQHISM